MRHLVATLFDSLSAIHRDHPDTGILRRLHPPGDTIQFVEGSMIEAFTGAETVDWMAATGEHRYAGLLTVTALRRGPGWVIRSHRVS